MGNFASHLRLRPFPTENTVSKLPRSNDTVVLYDDILVHRSRKPYCHGKRPGRTIRWSYTMTFWYTAVENRIATVNAQVEESDRILYISYEILQENRKGCSSCNIVQESCKILFNLTVRSYIKINLYVFL